MQKQFNTTKMSTSDYDEENDYYDDNDIYYQSNEEEFIDYKLVSKEGKQDNINTNIEFFEYQCVSIDEVKAQFNFSIHRICDTLKILPSISKLLLINTKWNEDELVEQFLLDKDGFLELKRIKPMSKKLDMSKSNDTDYSVDSLEELSYKKYLIKSGKDPSINLNHKVSCDVCLQSYSIGHHKSLYCEHYYCKDCWKNYLFYNIENGNATKIECMSTECQILVPEDFVYSFFTSTFILEKYDRLAFRDCINSHPLMRLCVGPDCTFAMKAKESMPKRTVCKKCNSIFCFECGDQYHAPSECKVIRLWMAKCEDDSETANYISANTKDCPNCGTCIEKNGGCNHMRCYSCKHEFCWMCLESWKSHGAQYYECSKFKETPIDTSSETEKARNALRKYLFYYDRWDNHMMSIKLEGKTMDVIKERINEKVMANSGTWIDWQYLLDAGSLLAKCRHTLQYTYPKAYFMRPGTDKSLFEYQQAQLEAEIENLSWKIEHAESTHRGDLENQMDIVDKRRIAILEDFFT